MGGYWPEGTLQLPLLVHSPVSKHKIPTWVVFVHLPVGNLGRSGTSSCFNLLGHLPPINGNFRSIDSLRFWEKASLGPCFPLNQGMILQIHPVFGLGESTKLTPPKIEHGTPKIRNLPKRFLLFPRADFQVPSQFVQPGYISETQQISLVTKI